MLRKHEINEKLRDVDFNAFQKAIGVEHNPKHGYILPIIEEDCKRQFSENLGGGCVVLHLLVVHQG